MSDITTLNLDAALIDQRVAGLFSGLAYAYAAVASGNGWTLGVAVANESGYCPVGGKSFASFEEASAFADGLNEHIGLGHETATRIIISTMGGNPYKA